MNELNCQDLRIVDYRHLLPIIVLYRYNAHEFSHSTYPIDSKNMLIFRN